MTEVSAQIDNRADRVTAHVAGTLNGADDQIRYTVPHVCVNNGTPLVDRARELRAARRQSLGLVQQHPLKQAQIRLY